MLLFILLLCADQNPEPMPKGKCYVIAVTNTLDVAHETARKFCGFAKEPQCLERMFVQTFDLDTSIEPLKELLQN